MSKILLPLAVLLALLVALWPSLRDALFEPDPIRRQRTVDDEPPPLPDPRLEGREVRNERLDEASESETGAENGDAGMSAPRSPPDGPEDASAPPAVVTVRRVFTGAMPEGWAEATPAQRPHAIRPPRGNRLGGGRGPGPTGHWTRFPPPPPPAGDAVLSVMVADERGLAVGGADVYLQPPSSLHAQAVSFGDLRKIGSTDASGRLLARSLPDGAAVVVANVGNLLNGRRGLDARHGIPVLLEPFQTVEARVTLPVDTGRLGVMAGRVRGPDGSALSRVAVILGFRRVYTDDDGRFEIDGVPAGTAKLRASRSGYQAATTEVEVEAGGRSTVEFDLGWRESGSLQLDGRVTGTDGAPVAGATLYLIDEKGRGTLRSVRTDADGRYRFVELPDRLSDAPCRLQAGAHQQGYPATNVRFEEGLDSRNLDVELPERQVLLRLHLVDAHSGDPVTRCRVEATTQTEGISPARRTFTGTRADGRYEHWFPRGTWEVLVEAPHHLAQKPAIILAPPGATVDETLRLAPRPEAGSAVTLEVMLQASGAPVEHAVIELLDPATDEVRSRFEGRGAAGRYSLPAMSGPCRLRVKAPGHDVEEREMDLPAEPAKTTVPVELDEA